MESVGKGLFLSRKIKTEAPFCVCSYKLPWIEKLTIVASNDINEDTIHSLNTQVRWLFYLSI